MPRERSTSIERLRRKLRKIEKKIDEKSKRRSRSRSRSTLWTRRTRSSRSKSPPGYWNPRSAHNKEIPSVSDMEEVDLTQTEAIRRSQTPATETAGNDASASVTKQMTFETKDDQAEVEISTEILALLGKAPEESAYGPDLLPQLCSRWEVIIKKGMEKEEKIKLMKKYAPPGNCKIIDAPKLNPEAQAAAGELVIKRDKAIEAKQKEVSCALVAVGQALNILCKTSGNEEIISLLSDGSRLLCDYHHCESATRKHFIVTGLDNKSAREAVRDTEVDQWLFGENFAEKLKASKAIERSIKELRGPPNKPRRWPTTNHLNFKGPANNAYKPKATVQKSGYHRYHPHQKKQTGNNSTKPYQQKDRYQQRYNNRR